MRAVFVTGCDDCSVISLAVHVLMLSVLAQKFYGKRPIDRLVSTCLALMLFRHALAFGLLLFLHEHGTFHAIITVTLFVIEKASYLFFVLILVKIKAR